jgi:hypothetical protein
MSIPIECPLCGFHKDVAISFAGKEVKCPHCETTFKVPIPQVTTLQVPGLMGKVPAKASREPERPGSASPEPVSRQRKRPARRWPMAIAGLLIVAAAGGTAAYFIFFQERNAEVTEAKPASEPVKPPSIDTAAEAARLAAEKKAAEEKAVRDQAAELARQKEAERKAREEKERLRKEEDKRALEEKKERERQERLAREEKERKEREVKEEAERRHAEKFNPKLAATVEEVDSAPENFFGKRLYFDNVRLKESAIDKAKDMDLFTLGVTSKAGKYYSRVVLGNVFFTADSRLIADIKKEWFRFEEFPRVRLYCEIRSYEKKAGSKPIPQAHIFKFEVFTAAGTSVKSWEEPEEAAAPPKADAEKGAK